MKQMDGRIPRLGAIAVVAIAIVVGAGTLVLYGIHGGATSSPASPSPAAVTGTGPPSMASQPVPTELASGPVPTGWSGDWPALAPFAGPGTMTLDFAGHGYAEVPVACMWWDSATIVSMERGSSGRVSANLYGEDVTLDFVGTGISPVLVIERQVGGRYLSAVDPFFTDPSVSSWGPYPTVDRLDFRLDASSSPAQPFKGSGATDTIVASVSWACGYPPRDVPLAPISPNHADELTRGSATLKLDATGASATGSLQCQWSSRSRVVYYTILVPMDIEGERVKPWILTYGAPRMGLAREGKVANYGADSGHFEAQGWETGRGTIRFNDLPLDPYSYPKKFPYPPLIPLPTQLDSFMVPLGGDEANRTLSGTLTWDCGDPPSGVPDVEPTPEPTASPDEGGRPFPIAHLRVAGSSTPAEPEANWCVSTIHVTDPARDPGDWLCGADPGSWYNPAPNKPKAVAEARPGSQLSFSIPGFKFQSVEIKLATVAEVKRWRGGQPDGAVTIKPASFSSSAVEFAAPEEGDWVAQFHVVATDSFGDRLDAIYLATLRVAE
jgi:hypothetical protein